MPQRPVSGRQAQECQSLYEWQSNRRHGNLLGKHDIVEQERKTVTNQGSETKLNASMHNRNRQGQRTMWGCRWTRVAPRVKPLNREGGKQQKPRKRENRNHPRVDTTQRMSLPNAMAAFTPGKTRETRKLTSSSTRIKLESTTYRRQHAPGTSGCFALGPKHVTDSTRL